jgi:hypothetical protein
MRVAFWGLVFFAASGLTGSSAFAQDYPAGIQVLHGTTDNDSLTIQCAPPAGDKMHCSFAQTMVSRPADQEDFEGRLSMAIDQALLPEPLKECGSITEFSQAVRDGRTPKGVDVAKYTKGMAAMKSEQKADLLNQLALMDAYCAKPTRETAEAMLRSVREKDLKTCKVWTNTYEQDFVTQDIGKTWISNQGPSGGCGVIYISKFEKTKDEFSFWTYTTQKVVTKKDGDPILNLCSGLDERQIFYDWNGDEKYLDCTYIKFGF